MRVMILWHRVCYCLIVCNSVFLLLRFYDDFQQLCYANIIERNNHCIFLLLNVALCHANRL